MSRFCASGEETFNNRLWSPYYRKRERASYVVREVRSVRERERERYRERERERERDESDVTLVALKLAMSFALFLAKNLHLSSSIGEEFALFLAKNLHLFLGLPS